MNILLVEDNETFASELIETLGGLKGVNVDLCVSRDAALQRLGDRFFDLIVLDLSIPTRDNQLDSEPEHGQSVFYEVLKLAPGTPVRILTGSEPDRFSAGLAKFGERIDLWGSGTAVPTIDHCMKERADELVGELAAAAAAVDALDAIEIDTYGRKLMLSAESKRALKVFTRQNAGASCLVEQLSGGLSDAQVHRVTVRDPRGNIGAVAIVKLGNAEKLSRESSAFERHVRVLTLNAFTPLMAKIDRGVRSQAALFYSIAEQYSRNLFQLVAGNPSVAPGIIVKVREGLARWSDAKYIAKVEIREVRRRLLSDEAVKELLKTHALPRHEEVEALVVSIFRSCIHGDLHGGNILVDNNMNPIMIDFGDVGEGFTCLDPITLEMSLLFHPDSKTHGISQQLQPLVAHWPDIDAYVARVDCADSIKSCRHWAHEVAGSDRAVLAAGYAFALRQLKYETIDHKTTLTLIQNLSEKLLQRD